MISAQQSTPVTMTFYPDYRAMNPYQSVLYEALQPVIEAHAGTITDALNRQARHPDRPQIFHLHWEHQILNDPSSTVEAFLNDLLRFRDAGGRVIWTLHNLEPHEDYDAGQLSDLYGGLCALVDIVQLHSLDAVEAASEVWDLPPEKIRVIPHGNYDGAYPNAHREAAREALGLQDARNVVLMPGRIAGYKRPDALIAAFIDAASEDDHLIMAGQFGKGVAPDTKGDARIILREGFASPEEVSQYHAACDFVVLPYAQSLTSGSAVLAATLGRGVLGPDTPGLRDVIASGRSGILYDPVDENALGVTLSMALNESVEIWAKRGTAARLSARARSMKLVAAAWRDLISVLLASANAKNAWMNNQ